MLTPTPIARRSRQPGFSMLEVLVSIVILVFGLLGLAALQGRMQLAETESYQRAQAILLLGDMVDRIVNNRPTLATAASFATTAPLGVGDTQPATCTQPPGIARDQCDWSNALKGAAEQQTGANAGAMIGARGCIEERQRFDPTPTVCLPEIYRVTVTWQGLNPTTAPTLTCGQGLYGDPRLQRSISAPVTVPLLGC